MCQWNGNAWFHFTPYEDSHQHSMRTYQYEDFAKFTFSNFWKYCANQTKAMYIFWRFVLLQLMYNEGAFLLLTCSWRMSLNVFVRMKCGDNVTNSVLIQISKKNKNKSHKIFLFYSNISILKTLFYCNSKVNIYNKENWFCIEIISILWQPNNLTN